jgi:hypothetical protein
MCALNITSLDCIILRQWAPQFVVDIATLKNAKYIDQFAGFNITSVFNAKDLDQ